MTNVCVVGNSHVACLKLAWDAGLRETRAGVDITFFASHSGSMRDLVRRGNRLVSDDPKVNRNLAYTSGGSVEIDPAAFDAIVLVGMGFGLVHLMQALKHHRLAMHHDGSADVQLVSEGFLDALLAHRLMRSIPIRIAGMVRAIAPEVPLLLVPDPLPRPSIVGRVPGWENEEALAFVATRLHRHAREIEGPGYDIRIVPQPQGTVEREYFTRDALSAGSLALSRTGKAHVEDELYHMNATFGSIMLGAVLDVVVARDRDSELPGFRATG